VRNAIAALSLFFLAAHLPFLPPTLEDIDSINFALGVADFDVARHQPHPPGYPVFIALGKTATFMLRLAQVPSPEVRGLALWSTLFGAALVVLLYALFRALAPAANPTRAAWATAVAALSPLFWFTALRPLSDTTGLAAAIAAQALIVPAISGHGKPRTLMYGAFIAGLAIGVRSQTFLLTLPLLGVAVAIPGSSLRARDRLAALAAAFAGVLLWAIPLVVASGGLSSYAAALGSQAGEDFSGVVMLWTMRTARVAVDALIYSFLWPWGHPIAGAIVVVTACAGAALMLWKSARTLAMILVAFAPYAIFHLLFHETITVRYALPLVVPLAYLAVYALERVGEGVIAGAVIGVVVWSAAVTLPATLAYGAQGSPAFRALNEASHAMPSGGQVVGLHAVARRAAEWLERRDARVSASSSPSSTAARFLKAPHGREWLTLIEHWRDHPESRISFVADPRRTDLALIDPASRRAPLPYRWSFVEPPFVGGTRPGDSDLYVLPPPGWMLDRGWALTAEIAGVTARDGLGPHRKPAVAWIRARPTAATLLLAGRHLGPAGDPAARMTVSFQGRALDVFDVTPGYFFRLVSLAPGLLAGQSGYVPLEVASAAADRSGRMLPVGLEQFDLQSTGAPMVGAKEGWYEPEYDPRTARAWRWTSERAVLWVRPIGRDVTLSFSGESPLRYYDAAPTVIVSAAGHELARFRPAADFTQSVVLPADALAAADGQVVIASDKFFVPAERSGSPDRRHLALKVFSYSVR
jgi:hypothetical protein